MILLCIAMALQAAASEPPVSLARVRAQLARPPALRIIHFELPQPMFRVEILGNRYWTAVPQTWNFSTPPMSPLLAPQGAGEPEMGITSSGGGGDVLPAIAAARQALRQRAARKEFQKTFAEFCATHDCSPR